MPDIKMWVVAHWPGNGKNRRLSGPFGSADEAFDWAERNEARQFQVLRLESPTVGV